MIGHVAAKEFESDAHVAPSAGVAQGVERARFVVVVEAVEARESMEVFDPHVPGSRPALSWQRGRLKQL